MFWKQADYWPEIRSDYDTLTKPYSEDDLKDTFKFLRKFCIMQCLYKKYKKVDSTYINGLFKAFDKVVHDTPKLIPDVAWDMSRNDNVVKMFPRYQVCEKDTKRYSLTPPRQSYFIILINWCKFALISRNTSKNRH